MINIGRLIAFDSADQKDIVYARTNNFSFIYGIFADNEARRALSELKYVQCGNLLIQNGGHGENFIGLNNVDVEKYHVIKTSLQHF